MDIELHDLAVEVGRTLKARGWMLVSAESCTGGWIGQAITMVPGSSEWFDRGFITYTNQAKMEMLGVSERTLSLHGAVSEPTVQEMVHGAIERSTAMVAVAVSGVAGPSGGSPLRPVGTVCVGCGVRGQPIGSWTMHFDGDRDTVRRETVIEALRKIREAAS